MIGFALSIVASAASSCIPGTLRQRPETRTIAPTAGNWIEPFKGALAGKYLLFHDGEFITLSGRGYFQIRTEIEYWHRSGEIKPIRFRGQKGNLLHVASGGGRRLDDEWPSEPGRNAFGRPGMKRSYMASGARIPWLNEYYYLDGSVTLRLSESNLGTINYGVAPVDYREVREGVEGGKNHKNYWIKSGIYYDKC
ncbi:hypothetical protein [Sphingomonas sp. VDB2]|uniref:hypothetical protein n=1 Tax=Sphingomonas sp. VDB2 TaxID=3228751 RepID=UPI003A80A92E